MPVYEYRCEACGIVFEAMQKFSDPPLAECKSCAGPVQKLISQTAFTLKGGGWYQQGYSESSGKPSPPCAAEGGGSGCGGCPKAANA